MNIRRKKPRRIALTHRGLIYFPNCVFYDKNIVSLDLSNNNISTIPSNIGELKKLRYLNLENNNISELHNGIISLPSIKQINLKGNPIRHLPGFVKNKLPRKVLIDYTPSVGVSRIIDPDGQKLFDEISDGIASINSYETMFEQTDTVPTLEDLTFSRSSNRIGKNLTSCVLYIDIRDSVKKNKEFSTQILAKMYSSFIYGVLKCAMSCEGHVRNIIGDRVMVVFDNKNCCDNALKCANALLCFVRDIMSKVMPTKVFDCGIGIHFGEMHVVKVGLTVKGIENKEYQNIVWIGEPANLASRLTDNAGKDDIPKIVISEEVYKRITDKLLLRGFIGISNAAIEDVGFNVYGRN